MIRHNDIVIDRARWTIAVGGLRYRFPVRGGRSIAFEAIGHMIMSGRITRRQLFDFLYARDESGGPVAGPAIFDHHLIYWAPMLAALGLTLGREKISGEQYLFLRRAA